MGKFKVGERVICISLELERRYGKAATIEKLYTGKDQKERVEVLFEEDSLKSTFYATRFRKLTKLEKVMK